MYTIPNLYLDAKMAKIKYEILGGFDISNFQSIIVSTVWVLGGGWIPPGLNDAFKLRKFGSLSQAKTLSFSLSTTYAIKMSYWILAILASR